MATFISKVTRENIVRLLTDGEKWVNVSLSAEKPPSLRWSHRDIRFFQYMNLCCSLCDKAMFGSYTVSDCVEYDGSRILKVVLFMVDICKLYLGKSKAGSFPIEPIQRALYLIREKLSIVGFSCVTVEAGMVKIKKDSDAVQRENIFINEIVRFRSVIRDVALKKRELDKSFSNEILHYCDEARDNLLPRLGVKVFDRKVGERRT